jgi:hypothetical protein
MWGEWNWPLGDLQVQVCAVLLSWNTWEVAGGVAQMVERSLSMREVRGSIPRASKVFSLSFYGQCFSLKVILNMCSDTDVSI